MESHWDQKTYADIAEKMFCPICHDVLLEARDLVCGHTYCLECVQRLVARKGWTSDIKCCLCQEMTSIPSTGVNGLEQNDKLNCIIQKQAAILDEIETSLSGGRGITDPHRQGTYLYRSLVRFGRRPQATGREETRHPTQ